MSSFALTEIAAGIFQTRTYSPRGLSFNQYFLRGSKTALISLGTVQMVDGIREALRSLGGKTDPDYLVIPHFEGDECGGLSRWLTHCPEAAPVCGEACGRQLAGFGFHQRPRTVTDRERLDLGGLDLDFLLTPFEVHLWDGLMVLEQRSKILFSNDLFMQRGDPPVVVRSLQEINPREIQTGSIPARGKLRATLERLTTLEISAVAPGHGAVLKFNPRDFITTLATQV